MTVYLLSRNRQVELNEDFINFLKNTPELEFKLV